MDPWLLQTIYLLLLILLAFFVTVAACLLLFAYYINKPASDLKEQKDANHHSRIKDDQGLPRR